MSDRQREWPKGWAGAAESDLEASLRATPAQRLEWLAEAQLFVWRAGAWPKDPEPSPNRGGHREPGSDS